MATEPAGKLPVIHLIPLYLSKSQHDVSACPEHVLGEYRIRGCMSFQHNCHQWTFFAGTEAENGNWISNVLSKLLWYQVGYYMFSFNENRASNVPVPWSLQNCAIMFTSGFIKPTGRFTLGLALESSQHSRLFQAIYLAVPEPRSSRADHECWSMNKANISKYKPLQTPWYTCCMNFCH